VSPARNHKVVVVGGGSAGLTISHQLLRSGKFTQDDIAVVDPAEWHHYQPGWTLVGGGLKTKDELRRPLQSLVDPKLKLYSDTLATFAPEDNSVTLGNGSKLTYDQLVVAPGIKVDLASIKGLPEAVSNPDSNVSCIYTFDTVDKVFPTIQRLRSGQAIFTQPAASSSARARRKRSCGSRSTTGSARVCTRPATTRHRSRSRSLRVCR
jgi:sulfide:quinone oxidoreductase